jgi:hypothetical protein
VVESHHRYRATRMLGACVRGVLHRDDSLRDLIGQRYGAPLEGGSAWADLEAGGLVCERCRPPANDLCGLDSADVENFRALGARRGGSAKAALAATPAVARAVDAFVSYHLGKRPKSRRLLDELSLRPAVRA